MSIPKSFPKNIAAIYFIANSANYKMNLLRNNYFIVNDLSKFETNELIAEFKLRAEKEQTKNSSDISDLYALLVALTFKDKKETDDFFKGVLKIEFEWFSDIAKIHLSSQQHTSFTTHNIPHNKPQVRVIPHEQKPPPNLKSFNL